MNNDVGVGVDVSNWRSVQVDHMEENKPRSNDPIPSDLVKDDPDYADIVVTFVEGLKDRLADMEDALRQSDFDTLRTTAHQLKGSGGGFGYPILTEHATRLERLAKARALQECIDAIGELKGLASRVVVGT